MQPWRLIESLQAFSCSLLECRLPIQAFKTVLCMSKRSSRWERESPIYIGPLTRVIHLNLFLDMVPSSSANFTRAIFPRCVFSWRKQRRTVMADRASSKRKFEVSNAPSNKRKKTSPNLFCSSGRREHNAFFKSENFWGFVWWWLKTAYTEVIAGRK